MLTRTSQHLLSLFRRSIHERLLKTALAGSFSAGHLNEKNRLFLSGGFRGRRLDEGSAGGGLGIAGGGGEDFVLLLVLSVHLQGRCCYDETDGSAHAAIP